MTFRTDRGYAVLSSNADGTTTVMICTGIDNGQPVNVYAKYVRTPNVQVDQSVRLLAGESGRYTDKIVEVFPADGALQVRVPRGGPAL